MARDYKKEDARQQKVGVVMFRIALDFPSLMAPPPPTGERGRPRVYGDRLVEGAAYLKALTGMSLRGVEGFVRACVRKFGPPDRPSIDATTLCRRIPGLKLSLPKRRLTDACLVGDGTGLRLVDEGGYKKLVHGPDKGKRRIYQQVVIIADAGTGEIVSIDTGPFKKGSASETDRIQGLAAHDIQGGTLIWDGAGDCKAAYDACEGLGLRFLAPPSKAAAAKSDVFPPKHPRTKAAREIQSIGRKAWKRKHGYHRRSFAESVNARYKQMTGSSLATRNEDAKRVDVMARALVFNATLQEDPRLMLQS